MLSEIISWSGWAPQALEEANIIFLEICLLQGLELLTKLLHILFSCIFKLFLTHILVGID